MGWIPHCTQDVISVGQQYELSVMGTVILSQGDGGVALKYGSLTDPILLEGTLRIEIIEEFEDFVQVEVQELNVSGSSPSGEMVETVLEPAVEMDDNQGEISKRFTNNTPFLESFLRINLGLEGVAGAPCGGSLNLVAATDTNTLSISEGVALDCTGNEQEVLESFSATLPSELVSRLQVP